MIYVVIVGAMVSLVLSVVTIALIVKCRKKLNSCNLCKGTIVHFVENTSEARVSSYENKAVSPLVIYMVGGVAHSFVGNYYSTKMKINQKVDILYDKDDASKATLKTGLYLAPAITGALAFFFCSLTVACILVRSTGLFV